MKYFALLTKLGENLLAQATALGTKLELTHMAVGDGGGSLPTPDTNQTKLIAEKRRAAINTLFIDDKNKNQIIAEQIIPEQDGGWWIREIGLFDKAGNLIAVANCPETYKPQLAEGSGRTQSIRIVLIVSHTESVTLKIDPSVVLATREYVNTEITVLDKKIDALSAQTKLDLNKKFDKANISGVKGNDNDKVPSLHLFTTEIGKLAVIGYSYSKIESDGRYQPKGNYAPAGDYATNTALNNGLNQKFDKTGGAIDGGVTGTALGVTRKSINSTLYLYPAPDSQTNGYAYFQYKIGNDWFGRVEVPRPVNNQTTRLMQVGDFGWGASKKENSIKETDFGINKHRTFGVFYHDSDAKNTPNGHQYGGGIFFGRDPAVSTHMLYSPDWSNRLYMRSSKSASTMNDWAEFYSTEIAKSDRNGHLKRTNFPDELSDYPVGAPIPWPQATAPSGFLVCNGQLFNKTTYPILAKAYPTGVLPDLRGEFLRGLDSGRNVDSGRAALSSQGDDNKEHNHNIILKNASGSGGSEQPALRTLSINVSNATYTTEKSGGKESRPRNIAFLYIVRAA
ncbi:phage tail protein [Providencia rettgeri]